jgi:sterol desaturase/sphingolipid hydroxylase (fatty acid hydroxylase superfamily)
MSVAFLADHVHRFVQRLYAPDVLLYLATLGAFMLVEALAMGYRQSSLRRLLSFSASARNDVVCDALYLFGFGHMFAVVGTLGLPLMFSLWYARNVGFTLLPHIAHPALAYLVWFVLTDFAYYWYHRFSHEIACLWQAHKYHHSAVEFNLITGNRVHFLDKAIEEVFKAVPLTMLGMPPAMYLAVRLTLRFVEIAQHSAVAWDFGWAGQWLVYGPMRHRIHHSAECEHWDSNYGNFLIVWDRIFGTWYAGDKVNETVGVSDNHFNTGSVAKDWYLATRFFARDVARGLRTGEWKTAYAKECAVRRRAAPRPQGRVRPGSIPGTTPRNAKSHLPRTSRA